MAKQEWLERYKVIEFSLAKLGQIIGAQVPAALADCVVSRVCTDSRLIEKGDLFFAIKGENFDGHRFIDQALQAGALAAVVEKDGPDGELPILKVESTRLALGQLASAARNEFAGHVVAITGSNGKTTTRRMLAEILSKVGKVCEAPKSFNNDIGVPLTILAAQKDDDFLLVEVGTNHPGEIDYLGKIVRPAVAIITGVGPSHLEGFDDSIAAVAKEKTQLLDHLVAGGLAIINGDDTLLCKALMDKPVKKSLFGMAKGLMWQCRDVRCSATGSVFEAADGLKVQLKVPGKHNVYNAMAALIAAGALGAGPAEIVEGLRNFQPAGMRLQVRQIGELTVINDAYNANPASMAPALEVLAMRAGTARKVAVLGDMLELGRQSEDLHRQLGRKVIECGVDLLITSGKMAKFTAAEALVAGMDQNAVKSFGNEDSDFAKMAKLLQPNDVVLLKGSRGMRMERLIP